MTRPIWVQLPATTPNLIMDKPVELPSITLEEAALVRQIEAGNFHRSCLDDYLTFVTKRRELVDGLVSQVYKEWPTNE